MDLSRILLILIALFLGFKSQISLGASSQKRMQVAFQFISLAPNAGGQEIYSLRLAKDSLEASFFSNLSIYAGSLPYSGGVLHWRFPVCDESCFWQFYSSIGVGGSNGGPITELTWSTVIPLIPLWLPFKAPSFYPALRLDVTTQTVYIRWRAVTWMYPFWLGISFPI